jgi:predicted Zn-dependent peptidase
MEVDPLLGREVREVVHDRVPLPRIYLSYRMPPFGTDGFEALYVAADLLGAGRASRLYRSLVRERQLAGDVTVFPFPVVGGASMFTIWATAREGIEADALEAALGSELERLAADGPTADELEHVRNLHAASVESSLERVAERADRLSMYTCLFDDPERINTEVTRYLAVDADRVVDAMRATLRPDNRLVLTYLPMPEAVTTAAEAEVAS